MQFSFTFAAQIK